MKPRKLQNKGLPAIIVMVVNFGVGVGVQWLVVIVVVVGWGGVVIIGGGFQRSYDELTP